MSQNVVKPCNTDIHMTRRGQTGKANPIASNVLAVIVESNQMK